MKTELQCNKSEMAFSGRRDQQDESALPRLAWLPLPLLLLFILVLYALDLITVYESPLLLMVLNFFFSTLISLFVAGMIGRSFLLRGTPGLLLLGCGVLFWGAAGFVGAVCSKIISGPAVFDLNTTVTIHNTCAWLSALCHLAGATWSLRWNVSLGSPRVWLVAGYGAVVATVGFVTWATVSGWIPTFFIQGVGGTFVRQVVIGVTIWMFVLSVILLRKANGGIRRSRFTYFYILALLLLSIGMFGVMLQPVMGSILTWAARTAQFLGGIYMCAAALASIRETKGSGISLYDPQGKPECQYAIVIALILSAAVFRMIFLTDLGPRVVYMPFYPAIIFAALYGGFWPGVITTLLSGALVNFYWLKPLGNFGVANSEDIPIMLLFLFIGIIISWMAKGISQAEERAIVAEAEAKTEQRTRHLASFPQLNPNPVIEVDSSGSITFFNAATEKFLARLGFDKESATVFFPDDIDNILKNLGRNEEESYSRELTIKDAVFNEIIHLIPRFNVVRIYIIEITERKRAEEALQIARAELESQVAARTKELVKTLDDLREKEHMLLQQSRTAAMGEMINNIAHQWRQPLNTLGLTVQQVRLFYDLGEFNKEFLHESTDGCMKVIQHMSQTIDDFLNFYKPDKEKEKFRVKDAVMKAIKLIEGALINQRITIAVDLSDELLIDGYQNEYSQVLLNILCNARDAFEERRPEHPAIVITAYKEGGKSVVTIRDNAGGIPDDIIGKIFEPHVTTKGSKGTGIGLFMAKCIIEKSMSGILGVSNTGDGAEFRIQA